MYMYKGQQLVGDLTGDGTKRGLIPMMTGLDESCICIILDPLCPYSHDF
jgi:hypothetical protein